MTLRNRERGGGSPVGHPHAERPNWRPAETLDDYERNCADGLETWSERRAAKLLGLPRAKIWRAKKKAAIPDELLQRLLAAGIGSAELSYIGRALAGGDLIGAQTECCPHCGGTLRVRSHISQKAYGIVAEFLSEVAPDLSP